jgi:hypothetical protein
MLQVQHRRWIVRAKIPHTALWAQALRTGKPGAYGLRERDRPTRPTPCLRAAQRTAGPLAPVLVW